MIFVLHASASPVHTHLGMVELQEFFVLIYSMKFKNELFGVEIDDSMALVMNIANLWTFFRVTVKDRSIMLSLQMHNLLSSVDIKRDNQAVLISGLNLDLNRIMLL